MYFFKSLGNFIKVQGVKVRLFILRGKGEAPKYC